MKKGSTIAFGAWMIVIIVIGILPMTPQGQSWGFRIPEMPTQEEFNAWFFTSWLFVAVLGFIPVFGYILWHEEVFK